MNRQILKALLTRVNKNQRENSLNITEVNLSVLLLRCSVCHHLYGIFRHFPFRELEATQQRQHGLFPL